MTIETLIKTLADGEYHSGEELGQLLGVSRTAVWKQLKKLESLGLQVESVKGKGYRMSAPLELLSQSQILALLKSSAEDVFAEIHRLEVCTRVDSTNAAVLRVYEQGAGHGCVSLAEQQSQGRGRRGRRWISPFGQNLYLSLGWEFGGGAAALEGLSLAVGLAVVRALQPYRIAELGLKWPNDILAKGKKLGGILLEMRGDAAGPCFVVIGIGLNVAMQEAAAGEIDQAWIDLQEAAEVCPGRNQLTAALLGELIRILRQFEQAGFAALKAEWERYDAFKGHTINIMTAAQVRQAVARGVTDSGALLIEADGMLEALHGGEISLRVAQ